VNTYLLICNSKLIFVVYLNKSYGPIVNSEVSVDLVYTGNTSVYATVVSIVCQLVSLDRPLDLTPTELLLPVSFGTLPCLSVVIMSRV
jgi:hypothetical protein